MLLLMRALLPKAALWAPHFTASSIARYGRRSGVKRLADRLAARPSEGTVVGVLLRYPNMAMTAHDLAGHAALPEGDVDSALSELARLGLVEVMHLAGTRFYRLTRQGRACDELRVLQEWHRAWQNQADRLSKAAGSGSGYSGLGSREREAERITWEKTSWE
jgi:hypothetical protein